MHVMRSVLVNLNRVSSLRAILIVRIHNVARIVFFMRRRRYTWKSWSKGFLATKITTWDFGNGDLFKRGKINFLLRFFTYDKLTT